MLDFNLNPLHYRDTFARQRRLQIRPLLQEPAARALHACLQQEVPWTLACRQDGQSRTLPRDHYASLCAQARMQLLAELAAQAQGGYGFAYESYMMVKAYKEAADPGLLLHRLLEYLNSGEFLDFARTVTGIDSIRRVSAQATRYRAGHFLRQHNDFEPAEGRLAAYVINLTSRWESDWGGLLHFLGDNGEVAETFHPYWNSLSLFQVPQPHFVSGVLAYAEEDRLSITGWFER